MFNKINEWLSKYDRNYKMYYYFSVIISVVCGWLYVYNAIKGNDVSGLGLLEDAQANNQSFTLSDKILSTIGMSILFFIPCYLVKVANDLLFNGERPKTFYGAVKKIVIGFAPSGFALLLIFMLGQWLLGLLSDNSSNIYVSWKEYFNIVGIIFTAFTITYGDTLKLQIQHENAMKEKDEQIAELTKTIADKDEQITQLTKTITDKDKKIESLTQKSENKDDQISMLTNQLIEKNATIDKLMNEKSEKLESENHILKDELHQYSQYKMLIDGYKFITNKFFKK